MQRRDCMVSSLLPLLEFAGKATAEGDTERTRQSLTEGPQRQQVPPIVSERTDTLFCEHSDIVS